MEYMHYGCTVVVLLMEVICTNLDFNWGSNLELKFAVELISKIIGKI